MSKTVFCRKYQEELEALAKPPFPGPKGLDILEHVSAKAWQEWTQHQTMLINENGLVMADPEARKFLAKEMEKYFFGEGSARPAGYVAPES